MKIMILLCCGAPAEPPRSFAQAAFLVDLRLLLPKRSKFSFSKAIGFEKLASIFERYFGKFAKKTELHELNF